MWARQRLPAACVCSLICLLTVAQPAQGQRVILWGNPPAGTDLSGFDVDARSWDRAAIGPTSLAKDLHVTSAAIAPIRLDPTVDLAPLGRALENREEVFDGDISTTWRDIGYDCGTLRNGCDDIFAFVGTNEVDLGGQYLVDRVVIRSGLDDPGLTVADFRVHVGAELPKTLWCCGLQYPVILEIRDNRQQVREVQLPGLVRGRFLQVAIGEREDGWEIHDIEIYGKGFVENAIFVSDVIDLGQPMTWGGLRWSGEAPGSAQIRVQTRSGNDADPLRYWRFTGRGTDREEVSAGRYANLRVGERAGTSHDQANWSFWSAPYTFADSAGTQIVSPGPQRYIQLRVDFLPGQEHGGQLQHIEWHAWPPLATSLVAEVWPVDVTAGTWQDFTYALRPSVAPDQSGFDRLELTSPARLGPVQSVRLGDRPVPWSIERAEPHRLVLQVPHIQAAESGALLEVDLQAQILRYGSRFDGRVWLASATPPTPQPVDAGDASGDYEGNRLSIGTGANARGTLHLDLEPAVLTANGDGVNDEVLVGYEILELIGAPDVVIDVVDLSGRRVRRLADGTAGIGIHQVRFDGRDQGGSPLPPGLYVVLARVSTDGQGIVRQQRILHIVR